MRYLASLGLTLFMLAAVGCEDDPTPPRLDGMQADAPLTTPDGGNTDGDTPAPDGQTPDSTVDGPVTTTDSTVDGPVADSTVDGPVTTTDSTVDGPVTTTDSTVDGPVTTTDSTVDGPVAVADSTVDGPVAVADSTVDGPVAVADSTVDGPVAVADSTVDGPVAVADSTVDTTAPVGEVLFASVPSETNASIRAWVGSGSSTAPVRGIYIDENGAPVRGTSITYGISGPATVDTSGDVTGGVLPSNSSATATLTATAPQASNTLDVVVARRTQATVTVSGNFNYLVSTNPGTVTLTHAQSGASTTVAGNGDFSLDLPAGSFYTLRASASSHANSHFSGVAPLADEDWGTVDLAMVSSFMFNIQMALLSCASNPASTGVVAGEVPGPGADGWEVFIAAPGASVAYVPDGSQIPSCSLTATGTSGQFTAFATPYGLHWLVARKLVGGDYQYRTALVHVSASGFSLSVGWQ